MRTVAMLANEAADAVNQGCAMPPAPMRDEARRQLPARTAGMGRTASACRRSDAVLANLARFYGEDRYRVPADPAARVRRKEDP